ncbi:feruloyl esterase B precursor [Aspergillus ellipticus CBS 707.79]|uniref:Carboxylic ester hydrolase n=1 Tax=Aspergillus ellipticus CBS 707.79 TaxID=1448320 RepID=A0A319DAC5_9EURO|nr:feruloyl esterase B precursor [Aspergillus ellipticus CBS 707.79]
MTTEAGTTYNFGLFLPNEWNERFLAVGNGGYAGGINWIDMGAGVGYGFAVMLTDTGHQGSYQDTAWAYQNEESIVDWAWRALHEATVTSKVIINDWYGQNSEYNYHSGCTDSEHTILQSMFNVIGDEVLKQCDPQDGLTDTIISDPLGCNFNPLTLLCKGNNSTDCLTSPQLDTLYQVYNDWVDVNQTFVSPHYLYGTKTSWNTAIGTGSLSSIENQSGFAQDLLQLGPDWNYTDLTYATVQYGDKVNPGNSTAGAFDITAFKSRSGKLIHHHGLADPTLPTGSSLYFYSQVDRDLAASNTTLDDFYRMFLIPGMEHCMSTPSAMNAPWYIAGANQAAQLGDNVSGVPGYRDAEHDIILALMNWVENGTAPNSIIATKYTDDSTHDEVCRQRPICPFPSQAKYTGSGNPDLPENWSCQSLY